MSEAVKTHDGAPSSIAVLLRPGTARVSSPPPTMSADFYRTLLDNMAKGVNLSAEDGTIVYTNPAEDRMFGYAAGELVGQPISIRSDCSAIRKRSCSPSPSRPLSIPTIMPQR